MEENRNRLHLVAVSLLSGGLMLILFLLLGTQRVPAHAEVVSAGRGAASGVESAGTVITVCRDGTCDYPVIQDAIDAAEAGEEIRVAAGTYTEVNHIGDLAQIIYLDKSLTIRGGYTSTDWTTSDPAANPTILDAQGEGRVLYITGEVDPTIAGLHITGGDATGLRGGFAGAMDAGGGLYVHLAGVTITRCQVLSNVADAGGGAYLHQSPAVVVGNAFAWNRATHGGGLTVSGGAPRLEDNAFEENVADWVGGALYVRGARAQIVDNDVRANDGGSGGGVCLKDDRSTLSGNLVAANTAGWCGGLYLYDSDTALAGTSILSNAADNGGGGLCVIQGLPTISDTLVLGDRAGQQGGGLYLSGTDVRLTNLVVADNGSGGAGSGIYAKEGAPELLHVTLAQNHSTEDGDGGSGIYVSGGAVSLVNTILAGHGVGIFVETGGVAHLESTLWGSGPWANDEDHDGDGTVVHGRRSYRGDPDFVDPAAGDYHLGSDSDALDRGASAGVLSDVDGHPRPIGFGIDVGADEWTGIDLSTSGKRADPDQVEVGETTTYTLRLLNSGYLNAEDVILYDPVPSPTTYVSGSLLATQGVVGHGSGISWTGTLTPGIPVTISFNVTVTAPGGFKNTAVITDAYGSANRLGAWVNAERWYLPLVFRSP